MATPPSYLRPWDGIYIQRGSSVSLHPAISYRNYPVSPIEAMIERGIGLGVPTAQIRFWFSVAKGIGTAFDQGMRTFQSGGFFGGGSSFAPNSAGWTTVRSGKATRTYIQPRVWLNGSQREYWGMSFWDQGSDASARYSFYVCWGRNLTVNADGTFAGITGCTGFTRQNGGNYYWDADGNPWVLSGGNWVRLVTDFRASDDWGVDNGRSGTTVEVDTPPIFRFNNYYSNIKQGQSYTRNNIPQAISGNSPITYHITKVLPRGLVFNPAHPSWSGTPSESGNFQITMVATDKDNDTAELTLNFNIAASDDTVDEDQTPRFATTLYARTLKKDQAYQNIDAPTATGGDAPIRYTSSGDLPDGMSFDGSGPSWSGTPTKVGLFTSRLTVTDNDGDTDTVQVRFNVASDDDSVPSFGAVSSYTRHLTVGQSYGATSMPTASGGDGNLDYDLSGSVPAGISFDSSGPSWSGSPTQAGTFNAVMTATDEDGDRDTINVIFNVQRTAITDRVPSFAALAYIRNINADESYPRTPFPLASGGNGPLRYGRVGSLPPGLLFFTNPPGWSGQPTEGGTYRMILRATDVDGDFADLGVTFTVAKAENKIPRFGINRYIRTLQTGQTYADSVIPDALGGDGTITYTVSGVIPSGINFNANTRTWSGTPDTVGVYELVLTATDENGDTDDLAVTFRIQSAAVTNPDPEVNPVPVFSIGLHTINIETDQSYDAQSLPTAFSGNPPLTYTLLGERPPGLTFSGEGGSAGIEWEGTPTSPGQWTLALNVSDSDGDSRALPIVFNVQGAAHVGPDTDVPEYRPMAGTGFGAILMIEMTGLYHLNTPNDRWIPIGQITDRIRLGMGNRLENITPPWAQWEEHAPGQKFSRGMTFPLLYNPDLATQSMRDIDATLSARASLFYAFWHNQRRRFRLWTKPRGSKRASTFDFYAYVEMLDLDHPEGAPSIIMVTLRPTGPIVSNWPSVRELVQGIRGLNLEEGT